MITAGNSSGIVDGAATVLVASERQGEGARSSKPRARIVEQVIVGSEPVIMLTGPIPATQKALQAHRPDDRRHRSRSRSTRPSRRCRCASCRRSASIPTKVNVNGGAIALGHPLGATGAMLIGTLIDELERTNKRYGLATMCIGIGMGIATIIERV